MTTSARSLARSARTVAVASLAVAAVAPDARAQRAVAPAGVSTVAAPPAAFTAQSRAALRVADGRAGRVLDHAVNGALIGLGISAVVAIVAAETADVQSGVPPVVLVPLATVAGAVVGTVVGLVRTQ